MNEQSFSLRAGLLVLGTVIGFGVELVVLYLAAAAGLPLSGLILISLTSVVATMVWQATRLRSYVGLALIIGTAAPGPLALIWLALLLNALE